MACGGRQLEQAAQPSTQGHLPLPVDRASLAALDGDMPEARLHQAWMQLEGGQLREGIQMLTALLRDAIDTPLAASAVALLADYAEVIAEPLAFASLPLSARWPWLQTRLARARRQGKPVPPGLHCPEAWQVIEPRTATPSLDFDVARPEAEAHELASSYPAARPGRRRMRREVKARACALTLKASGLHDARAELRLPAQGTYSLLIASDAQLELHVGAQRLRRDARDAAQPRWQVIQLPKGSRQLTLRLAALTVRKQQRVTLVAARQPAPREVSRTRSPAWRAWLEAHHAFVQGQPGHARHLLAQSALGESLLGRWLEARAARQDRLRPKEARQQAERRAWRSLRAALPRLWRPALAESRFLMEDGQIAEAERQLDALVAMHKQVPALRRAWVDLRMTRGATLTVAREAQSLAERFPEDCDLLSRLVAAQQGGPSEARSLTLAALSRCDRGAGASRQLLEAIAEGDPTAAKKAHAILQAQLGDAVPEALARRYARFNGEAPPRPWSDLEAARKHWLATDSAPTVAELREIDAQPGGDALLDALLLGLREASAPICESYWSRAGDYGAPSVWVLDFTLMRVFPDGSALEYTHNLIALNTEGTVESESEVRVPEDAYTLALRTRKADGSVLDGQRIPGKPGITLPQVSVGDIVERSYLRHLAPAEAFPAGFASPRFFFRSPDATFDRTEFVVAYPEAFAAKVEARGAAPKAQLQQRKDGLRVLRFRADAQPPLQTEALAPPLPEWAPSVRVGAAVDWETLRRGFLERLRSRQPRDPRDLAWLAAHFGTPKPSPEQLFAYVVASIEETGELFGLAPVMRAAGRGNRARVLHYLLQLSGYEATLWLAELLPSRDPRGAFADESRFTRPVVRVRDAQGFRWFDPTQRDAPAGYLAALIRGQSAICVSDTRRCPKAPVALPRQTLPDADTLDIEVTGTLAADGSARLEVLERRRGLSAFSWRESLRGLPEARRKAQAEAGYVAGWLPGATVTAFEARHLDDPAQPLELRMTLQVPQLLAAQGSARLRPWLLPRLAARLAPTVKRERVLVVPVPIARRLTLRLRLPKAIGALRLPKEARVSAERGALRYHRRWSQAGQELVLKREIDIEPKRIEPAGYPVLRQKLQQVDRHCAQTPTFTLQPSAQSGAKLN